MKLVMDIDASQMPNGTVIRDNDFNDWVSCNGYWMKINENKHFELGQSYLNTASKNNIFLITCNTNAPVKYDFHSLKDQKNEYDVVCIENQNKKNLNLNIKVKKGRPVTKTKRFERKPTKYNHFVKNWMLNNSSLQMSNSEKMKMCALEWKKEKSM